MPKHGIGQSSPLDAYELTRQFPINLAEHEKQVQEEFRHREAAQSAQIQMAEQLAAMNKRLDQEREERVASDEHERTRFAWNLSIGIVSAIAAIIAAVMSVLTFFR